MKMLNSVAVGFLAVIGLLPLDCFGFAVTADRTTIFVGESVRLTVSGPASDLTLFSVGINPDFNYFSESAARLGVEVNPPVLPPDPPEYEPCLLNSMKFVAGSTTATSGPYDCVESNEDPLLGAPLLLILSSEIVNLNPSCFDDPDEGCIFVQVPFAVIDGPVVTLDLIGIAATAPGSTTIPLVICQSLDCLPAPFGTGPVIPLSIDITILQRDGTAVPEPATLWLAFAALIAGGAVFRNGSKRS